MTTTIIAPHTPYRTLAELNGETSVSRPAWAEHLSVYRGGGRTLYIAEPARIDRAAKRDFDRLTKAGWTVVTETIPGRTDRVRVSMTRA
ncbi:hypothetical protein [Leucobacter sp. M11]|uniref:hypothetical protein n=1 Tax=Leucobacter sp. M11 TaxID=2993565 RepID=UPI002D7F7FA9|nr:hypothetical protein [Leucobacter sp. M11]MEB4614382.1 hypothetical protein [Leucobacter sp. M11]